MGHGNGFPSPHANTIDPDDPERPRPQPARRRPADADLVLRRGAPRRVGPPRAERGRHPRPPLLRRGQLRGRLRGPCPPTWRASAPTTSPPASSPPGPAPSSPTRGSGLGRALHRRALLHGRRRSRTSSGPPRARTAPTTSPRASGRPARTGPRPGDGTYWRALSAYPALLAGDVVGGRVSDTSADPASLQVPGAAEAGPPARPAVRDPAATPRRPSWPPARASASFAIRHAGRRGPLAGMDAVEVVTLDGGIGGLVAASSSCRATAGRRWPTRSRDRRRALAERRRLQRRSSRSPAASPSLPRGPRRLVTSPGAHARSRRPAAATRSRSRGTAPPNGVAGPDGALRLLVQAADAWQQHGRRRLRSTLALDVTVPTLSATIPATPDRHLAGRGQARHTLRRHSRRARRRRSRSPSAMPRASSWIRARSRRRPVRAPSIWDGTGRAAAALPDGAYTYQLVPRDAAGNVGPPVDPSGHRHDAHRRVRSTALVFDPAYAGATVRDAALSSRSRGRRP